jgi:signal transduction histidine kinase
VIDRIAGRLFLSYLVVVAIGLVVASAAIAGLIVRYENDATRQRLNDISQPLFTAVQNGLRQGRAPQDIIQTLTDEARAIDARIVVVATQSRRVTVDSEGRLEGQVVLPNPSGTEGVFTFREKDEDWLFVQRAVNPAGTLIVARRRAAFGETVRQLVPSIGIGAGAAAAVALLLAALLARTITRPLRELVRGARRFAGGDLRARVIAGGPGEVRDLGRAFNEMADEIERARGSERAFLADMSHELRTPLTSIQGFSQAIVEGEVQGDGVSWAARTIQREARRLIRMVEGLLQVARIESGTTQSAREPVALAEVLRGAVAALEVQAREAGVEIHEPAGDLPPVVGDADRLSQLFLNVLDNAVKHSPRGTSVEVGAAAQDGHVIVRVRDRGAGIPAGAEARVFERFYRGGDVDREGAGLGLAIAQAIAQAHGGHIEARNVEGGAEFRVVLPVAQRDKGRL